MTVLITGGAGFIGTHLVRALTASNAAIRVAHRTVESQEDMRVGHPLAEHVIADVTDRSGIRGALANVSTVYHLAGFGSPGSTHEDDIKILRVNVTGTCTLLQESVAAGVERFVFASSASVYGDSPESPKTESMPTLPKSVYAASKIAGEDLCRVFHSQRGLDTRILRYFNVYGPDQDATMVVPRFVGMLMAGETVTLYGDGSQTRDFVHISDVVRATMLAGSVADPGSRIYNIASGSPTSIREMVEALSAALGVTAEVAYLPERPGEIRESLASTRIASDSLGFTAEVGLEQGLRNTLNPSHRFASTS